jgi:hypothetical protein
MLHGMRACLSVFAILLPFCLGCATSSIYRGEPAELCNTPGRKMLSERIMARGGKLIEGDTKWDGSLDAAAKEKMGPPLTEIILPQDKFSAQDISEARVMFPEAQVVTPLTFDEVDADPSQFGGTRPLGSSGSGP